MGHRMCAHVFITPGHGEETFGLPTDKKHHVSGHDGDDGAPS